ncbi:MAG: aminoacyl-tRNA hydrolase [Candidatus Gribaldobacteria bacterium]|nr:aminoacyl-tRNA hydrolase [Candidatus Gribaldobacteria bacterium]
MIIIVGLGNVGVEYENTPHNMGFMAVDFFAKENDFPEFKSKTKLHALVSAGKIGAEKVILAKPQTFMNNSGLAVKELLTFYKLTPTNLLVVHDDLAFTSSKIKLVTNRTANHHKGVESIIQTLDTQNFMRLRLGINPNSVLHTPKEIKTDLDTGDLKKLVLKKMVGTEKTDTKRALKKASEILKFVITDGLDKAMTRYNQTK